MTVTFQHLGWASQVWLNGRILPRQEARVSVLDRGFLLGDGVYETVRAHRGRVFRWMPHRQRLEKSLSQAKIRLPFPWETLEEGIGACLLANDLQEARIRVTISRGEGGPGLEVPSPPQPATVLVAASPYRPLPEEKYVQGVAVHIASIRQTRRESLDPGLKSTSRIHLVLARLEASESGAHEAILLDAEETVAEATSSNVFIVHQNVLCTPPLRAGILAGVTRAAVLELAREAAFNHRETTVGRRELVQAEEVFLTNTSWGVLPVTRLDGKLVGEGKPGPFTQELRKRLEDLMEHECRI